MRNKVMNLAVQMTCNFQCWVVLCDVTKGSECDMICPTHSARLCPLIVADLFF